MTKHFHLNWKVRAPIRAHVTFFVLRRLGVPEAAALDLVWGWYK